MGIFSRIGDVLKANINDMIDRAEDPEKMVKQIIRELQEEVAKSTQALGKAMASERIARRQFENAQAVSANWESRAKAALNAGDVDLAKRALASKVKADGDTQTYETMYKQVSAQTQQLRETVETLHGKLNEAKSRQNMLIARAQMAKTQKEIAASVGGIGTSSAMDKFARIEERVEQQEAEAAAFAEIAAGSSSAEEMKTFEQLQQDMAVDAELQRLMEEMGQTSIPKEEGDVL